MIVERLTLYGGYTREDVNNIFNPQTPFTPGSGIYGMHGLIRVPKTNASPDFIFFITIGQNRTGYEFTENISKEGKLKWQSQPSQTLNNERIIQLINHDENRNNVFLFIRHGNQLKEYIYLGPLAYVSHDPRKERPVHFVWQIVEWSQYAIDKLREIGIDVIENNILDGLTFVESNLIEVEPPKNIELNTTLYIGKIEENYKPNYMAIQEKAIQISEGGVHLVLNHEKEYLLANNLPDLAQNVIKMSCTNGGVGYDILSYDLNGNEKLIGVKTTSGGKSLGFYISPNEVSISSQYPNKYYIYRIFDYNQETNTGKYFVIQGSVEENFKLTPSEFKAVYME